MLLEMGCFDSVSFFLVVCASVYPTQVLNSSVDSAGKMLLYTKPNEAKMSFPVLVSYAYLSKTK